MKLVSQPGKPLAGEVSLPGDKSLSHRAAWFAALADGQSVIHHFLVSGVTQAMLEALTALGVPWTLTGSCLTVQGQGLRGLTSPAYPIYCGNSATTLRLLAGGLAAAGTPAILDGSQGLRKRPMDRIIVPLQKMGALIQSSQGCAPLVIGASHLPLRALDYHLPVASAQVKSCLLLAALAADGSTVLSEPGPSRDHTERMLKWMGVEVVSGNGFVTRLTPPSPLRLKPLELILPGDISAAAFLIVAALIVPGSDITIHSVGLNPTRTGLLDVLLDMRANLEIIPYPDQAGEPVGDVIVRGSELTGVEVNGSRVVRMIDEFPAFAIAAAYATGITVVKDAQELRYKESDRIAALCQELRRLGIAASETPDGFIIQGGLPVTGGVVSAHGDHRLAMALSLAGLIAQAPVSVTGAEMLDESFPGFIGALHQLGADIQTIVDA